MTHDLATNELGWDELCKRAAICLDYSQFRLFVVRLRLTEVAALLDELGWQRGYQTRIAYELGISRATVCRDVARLTRGELQTDDWKQTLATIMLPPHELAAARVRAIAAREAHNARSQRADTGPAIARAEPSAPRPRPQGYPVQVPIWLPQSGEAASRFRRPMPGGPDSRHPRRR